MGRDEMMKLMGVLVALQEECAPITLTIGGVTENNMVTHDCVTIKEAPPVVMRTLVEHGYSLFVNKNGVTVYKI